jgi:hypothetical protein
VLEAGPETALPKIGRRIEGFEWSHWKRWGDALGPTGVEGDLHGGLLLVTDGEDHLLRAVHSARGRLDIDTVRPGCSLAQLAADHGCWWVLRLCSTDLEALCAQPWARTGDADYLERLLELWGALQDLQGDGRLASWPHRLDTWPALVDLAPRGLAPLCPDEHAAVAAIWRGNRLSTALAFRRHRGRIDRVVGPTILQPAMGLVSGDWTRDYRYLSQAVERLVGPLGLGFFAQEAAMRELSRQGDAAAWARAVAARDVIVSPMSAGLAMPLGLDLGRSALRRARDFVTSRSWGIRIPPELGSLFESEARRPDLRDLLGLDAFSMLWEAAGLQEQGAQPSSYSPFAGLGR